MEKSAVEWLYDNLKSHFEHNGDLLEVVQFSFEQAKEMFKQQFIDAYIQGSLDTYKKEPKNGQGIKYYNEKFKTK